MHAVGADFPARLIAWAIFQNFLVSPVQPAHAVITPFPGSWHDRRMTYPPILDFIGPNAQPRSRLNATTTRKKGWKSVYPKR
jgi:hypothetical protein